MSLTSYLAAPSRDFVTRPDTGHSGSLSHPAPLVKENLKKDRISGSVSVLLEYTTGLNIKEDAA